MMSMFDTLENDIPEFKEYNEYLPRNNQSQYHKVIVVQKHHKIGFRFFETHVVSSFESILYQTLRTHSL